MLCDGAAALRSWRDAQTDCVSHNMHLARIDDVAQNTWLREAVTAAGFRGTALWLGGSDIDGRGDWTWTDGTVFWVAGGRPATNGYTNWAAGEPRSAGIRQDCLVMANNGQWRDMLCTFLNAYVCQGTPTATNAGP